MCSIHSYKHRCMPGQEIQDIHVSHWVMLATHDRAGSLFLNDSITVAREVIGGVWLDKQLITSASALQGSQRPSLFQQGPRHTQLTAVHTCNTLFSPQWIFIKAWSGWPLISWVTFKSSDAQVKTYEWRVCTSQLNLLCRFHFQG